MNPNNEPAFPATVRQATGQNIHFPGLTMLDAFAIGAMPAVYATIDRLLQDQKITAERAAGLIADTSYEIAIAMLKEREKHP